MKREEWKESDWFILRLILVCGLGMVGFFRDNSHSDAEEANDTVNRADAIIARLKK